MWCGVVWGSCLLEDWYRLIHYVGVVWCGVGKLFAGGLVWAGPAVLVKGQICTTGSQQVTVPPVIAKKE